MFRLLLLIACGLALGEKTYYHTYHHTKLSDEDLQGYVDAGIAPYCTIAIEDCDPNEGRRLDATCMNLKHPAMGATKTPFTRILNASYDGVDGVRKSACGDPLPNVRKLRTELMSDGQGTDEYFTVYLTFIWVWFAGDFEFATDVANTVYCEPACCSAEGKGQNKCYNIEIPADDPVHRFSGHRCLNLTYPITYQNVGCLANGTTPERIDTQTPMADLSNLYGSNVERQGSILRLYERGLLNYEELDGEIWPPSDPTQTICAQNVKPHETRCHAVPNLPNNGILPFSVAVIWFWRHHNYIAEQLAIVNPDWDDEKLFTLARELNIATYQHMIYYEMYAALLGRDNMIRDGILSDSDGFRDIYDETLLPQQPVEFMAVLRWAHIMQESTLELYDDSGNFLNTFPAVNGSFRTGWLAVDNHYQQLTNGVFRQASADGLDTVVHPDLSEVGSGNVLIAEDIFANDALKTRLFGLRPYVDYREWSTGKNYTTWDDLTDAIPANRVRLLKRMYSHPCDVDMLAGVWLEKSVDGGYVPPTVYSIVAHQLLHNIKTDRHWYELENRPNAFTYEQLQEVRKFTSAHLLCHAGGVKQVQPKAFYIPGKDNEIASCDKLEKIDFSVFKDDSC